MPILVKGNKVSFLRADNGEEIFLPPESCICHDVNGEIVRGCDFYIVGIHFVRAGISSSDDVIRKAAIDYYGEEEELVEVRVALPQSGWKHWCDVKAIRYDRTGFLAAPYEHEYAEPQPLYKCSKPRAFKISSPDHCVANHRGFVYP
jgi:hypothetical protein